MIRRLKVLAMALSLSALMAASVQAAPNKTLSPKPTQEVGLLAEAWKLLSAWLQGHTVSPPGIPEAPDNSSQIDPNGGHH